MSIEISPPPAKTPAKASSTTGAHAAKAAKGPADAGQDNGATGFMAILGALGDAASQDTAPTVAATDAAPADAALGAQPFDATALLQQNPQIAAAQAAAQAALRAAGAAAPTDTKAPDTGAISLTEQAATPAVPTLDTAPQAAAPAENTQGRARTAAATAQDASDSLASTAASTEKPTTDLQRAGAHASKVAKEAAAAAAADTGANTNSTATSTERPELKDSKLLAAIEQARTASSTRTPEPVVMASLAKAEKSQNERAAQSFKVSEPTYSGTALGVSAPDFSQSAAQVAAVPPEMQVAEQVTYWVSQNVQNAELQLDGLGKTPVEVSISVQGNEAQITFRSDEAQTRGVLESAGAHLKDMLQREGMVLTGVSVGTSGGGGASGSGGERRGRPNVRQVAIGPLEAATASAARRVGQDAGRSVDLFV